MRGRLVLAAAFLALLSVRTAAGPPSEAFTNLLVRCRSEDVPNVMKALADVSVVIHDLQTMERLRRVKSHVDAHAAYETVLRCVEQQRTAGHVTRLVSLIVDGESATLIVEALAREDVDALARCLPRLVEVEVEEHDDGTLVGQMSTLLAPVTVPLRGDLSLALAASLASGAGFHVNIGTSLREVDDAASYMVLNARLVGRMGASSDLGAALNLMSHGAVVSSLAVEWSEDGSPWRIDIELAQRMY
jgi:hypothetical protein